MEYEHTCLIRGDGGRTLRAILDQICNKWTLLVVATLDQANLRFTELHRQIPGISQVPPRVEYALTPTGQSLLAPALALAGWAIEHVPEIEASRAAYQPGKP